MSKTVFKPRTKLQGLLPVPQNYMRQTVGKGHNPVVKYLHPATYPLANWGNGGC